MEIAKIEKSTVVQQTSWKGFLILAWKESIVIIFKQESHEIYIFSKFRSINVSRTFNNL